jgi:hypothetical protein
LVWEHTNRDRDRDVSEKIALGLAQPTGQDMQFDQRLFNQTAGMDSGFGAEDGYSLYDKPLFQVCCVCVRKGGVLFPPIYLISDFIYDQVSSRALYNPLCVMYLHERMRHVCACGVYMWENKEYAFRFWLYACACIFDLGEQALAAVYSAHIR